MNTNSRPILKVRKFQTLLLGVSVNLLLNGSASAETWQIDPTFDVRVGYDDNIRLREIDDAAQETRVGGSLSLARLTEISETRAYLRGNYVAYASADDQSLEDADSLQIGLNTRRKLSELQGLSLSVEYIGDTVGGSSRLDQDIIVGDQVDVIEGVVSTQIDRDRLRIAPRWESELTELSKLGVDYTYEDVEFDTNISGFLRDYDWHRFGVDYAYKSNDRTTWKPRLDYVSYEAATGEEVESTQLRMGFERLLSETSRFWINVGAHSTDLTTNGVESSDDGLVFDANYLKQTERTVTSLRIERQLAPGGNGELLATNSLSASLSGRLRERFGYTVYASYFVTEDAFSDINNIADRSYAILAPQLNYEVLEHWRLGVQYRFRMSDDENRLDDLGNQLDSVDSNGFFLTLNYLPSKAAR